MPASSSALVAKPPHSGVRSSLREVRARLAAKLGTLGRIRRSSGIGTAARTIVERCGARVCQLMVAHVVWLDAGEILVSAASAPAFQFRFLTADEVARHAADPECDLEPDLAERVAAGRNFCFAALDGERLAAYGWYARREIEPEHCFGFGLRMPPHVVYMYKGFTHPEYRGRRLHGLVMGLALRKFTTDGVTALISTVEWTNEASLKSCARSGYRQLGKLVRWRFLGREYASAPRGVRERQVEVYLPRAASMKTLTIF